MSTHKLAVQLNGQICGEFDDVLDDMSVEDIKERVRNDEDIKRMLDNLCKKMEYYIEDIVVIPKQLVNLIIKKRGK